MPKVYVFQHVPYEGLGSFETAFSKAGVETRFFPSYREDLSRLSLVADPDCAGVVVMGGPMSANDGEKIPFIREELRLIDETLRAEIPFLGVCLGSQLLAKALGSRVYRGEKKEIGWYPLWLRPEAKGDALLGDFPSRLEMFQWHGETFELPRGAMLLASSQLYLHQAFRYGKNAYGLQFHAEMTPEMIADWHREGQKEIEAADLTAIWEERDALIARHVPALNRYAEEIAKGFISLVGSPRYD